MNIQNLIDNKTSVSKKTIGHVLGGLYLVAGMCTLGGIILADKMVLEMGIKEGCSYAYPKHTQGGSKLLRLHAKYCGR